MPHGVAKIKKIEREKKKREREREKEGRKGKEIDSPLESPERKTAVLTS